MSIEQVFNSMTYIFLKFNSNHKFLVSFWNQMCFNFYGIHHKW